MIHDATSSPERIVDSVLGITPQRRVAAPLSRKRLMGISATVDRPKRSRVSPRVPQFACPRRLKQCPCVLSFVEGKNLVFYGLDPVRGKGRELGKVEAQTKTLPVGMSPRWLAGGGGLTTATRGKLKY